MPKKRAIRKAFCCSAAQLDTANIEFLISVQPDLCHKLLDDAVDNGKQDCLLADKMVEKGKISKADIDSKVLAKTKGKS